MATIDNILTLIEKGYSKSEIDNLLAQDETDVPESSQDDATESQDDANESQEVETEEDPGEPSPLDLLTKQVLDLTEQVKTMTAAVQLNNVKNAEQPAGGKNQEMSATDFLAQLINPKYKEEDIT